jgi:ankyrin repeat protein
MVKYLFSQPDINGATSFLFALEGRHEDIAMMLMRHSTFGIALNSRNRRTRNRDRIDKSSLEIAAQGVLITITKYLLAQINFSGEESTKLVWGALRGGDNGAILLLVLDSFDSSLSLSPAPGDHWKRGVTPLHYVATYRGPTNLRILLVRAAILNFDNLLKPLVENQKVDLNCKAEMEEPALQLPS